MNTPRVITNAANQTVWKLDNNDPFGANMPDENPAGLGPFKFNLRFAGQYFDVETGLHDNYFRTYDPRLGEYLQSDPIGLRGGWNTYAYVDSNPIRFKDPFGLDAKSATMGTGSYLRSLFGGARRECKIREILKRRNACDFLMEKFSRGIPLTPSESASLEYLYKQQRKDAISAASLGVEFARAAMEDGITGGRGVVKDALRGTVESTVKAVGRVGTKVLGRETGEHLASQSVGGMRNPGLDYHVETSAECEED